MSPQMKIRHTQHYAYDQLVTFGLQEIRLYPAFHCATPVYDYALTVSQSTSRIRWSTDTCNNRVAMVQLPDPGDEFQVTVEFTTSIAPTRSECFEQDQVASYPFEYQFRKDLAPYLEPDESGSLLREFASQGNIPEHSLEVLAWVLDKQQKILRHETRLADNFQNCETTLKRGLGTTTDWTWLFVQTMRKLGFAARFAAGYQIDLESPGKGYDEVQYRLWSEVFLGGVGWIGVDPTQARQTDENYLPLAVGPHPDRVAALSGTRSKAVVSASESLQIYRMKDTPTVPERYIRGLPLPTIERPLAEYYGEE